MAQYDVHLIPRQDTIQNWEASASLILTGELAIGINPDGSIGELKVGANDVWGNTLGLAAYTDADTLNVIGNRIESSDSILFYYDSVSETYKFDVINPIPTQTGNSGKYLTTDGNTASWGEAITTDILPAQQVLLSNPTNWSTPTANSASYYIGTTALSGNYQGQYYFDGLFWYIFIADDYPIRIGGNLHGILIQNSTIPNAALETSLQNKIAFANDQSIELKINPDFSTSDDVIIEGVVYDVTEERTADDGTVPAAGTFTYSYKDVVGSNPQWVTNQTLAQLKTKLTSHSSSSKTKIKATNTTTTVLNSVIVHLKRYL